ncbi:NlpC/P60 family protein [Lentibacillus saliphilus]|uniref:C40 family peptidase n=1 Tax=Lentibacillus saliphilus TaxID=2737028 RepID=UPI001C311A52|nr:NlpC/P60 family protein [Lentibacillus saliphilus]
MLNGTVEQVVKHSFLYSYMLSQPFSVYVDAYPVLQNNILLEAEQVQYGEHGETVRILQHKMNLLNYYDDDIDGDFGIFTEHALKKIQADLNIKITGEADFQTLHSIVELEKEKHVEKLKTMSGSVQQGMNSEDVKIVQETLQYFGYYTGEVDGLFGPLTTKAVEKAEDIHDIQLMPQVTETALQTLYETDTTESTVSTNQQPAQQETEATEQKKPVETKEVKKKSGNDVTSLIQTAQSLLGTPYVWGGTSPGGFDCSGFIQYVFKSQNKTTPRTVSDMWNFSQPVNNRSIGDLVFFETYKPGPSHMGIYIGDGKFIHAGVSKGVSVSHLSENYWKTRYLGTRRVQ